MRFLVDAQLPVRLVRHLRAAGHDVVHSSELPDGNRTSDAVLAELADVDDRVIVTKDRDFEISHVLRGCPQRLLLVTTGNITNNALLELFARNGDVIERELATSAYVELSADAIIVRRTRQDPSG